jgi:hypothetical protein
MARVLRRRPGGAHRTAANRRGGPRRARRPPDASCVASAAGRRGRSSPWSLRNRVGTADGALQSTVATDCHEEGPPGDTLVVFTEKRAPRRPAHMLHAGLDLSRKKLDVCLLSGRGEHLDQLAVPPEVDSLRRLARGIGEVHAEPVSAVVESMTGRGSSTTRSRPRAGSLQRSLAPPRSSLARTPKSPGSRRRMHPGRRWRLP